MLNFAWPVAWQFMVFFDHYFWIRCLLLTTVAVLSNPRIYVIFTVNKFSIYLNHSEFKTLNCSTKAEVIWILKLRESWVIFVNNSHSWVICMSWLIKSILTNFWHHWMFVTPLEEKATREFWPSCIIDGSKTRYVLTIPNVCIPLNHTKSIT